MKKDRSITIRRIPVVSSAGADTNFVVVRVFYGIGGMNYFSGAILPNLPGVTQ